MVALMAAVTVMMIASTATLPYWKYIVRNDREEELLFRGNSIARAVFRYQQKTGAQPISLDQMVKGKYLRKAYKDPMSKEGKWRFLRPGETLGPALPQGMSGLSQARPVAPNAGPTATMDGQVFGGIFGVASTSTDKALRVINGRSKYNEWLFLAGQPELSTLRPAVIGPGGVPGGLPGGLGQQSPSFRQPSPQPRPGSPGFNPSPGSGFGPGFGPGGTSRGGVPPPTTVEN
jgi:hypothetical protein